MLKPKTSLVMEKINMASDKGNSGAGSVQTLISAAATAVSAAAEAQTAALKAAQSRLAEIDTEREALVETIATLGGEPRKGSRGRKGARSSKGSGRTGKRASNSVSLREAVARALTDKAQSPTEIQEAVVKAGYKTNSPNFPQMVAQHLSNLGRLRMGKSPVAVNEDRGLWTSGSGMERYLADPSAAVEA